MDSLFLVTKPIRGLLVIVFVVMLAGVPILMIGGGSKLEQLNPSMNIEDESHDPSSQWRGGFTAGNRAPRYDGRYLTLLSYLFSSGCIICLVLLIYYEKKYLKQRKTIKLCTQERDLLASESGRYRQLHDTSPLIVMNWFDAEKEVFDYISKGISRYGYDASDFIERSLFYRDIIHPDDLKHIIRQRFDHLKTNISTYSQQYRILCPSDITPVHIDPAMEILMHRNRVLQKARSVNTKWVADRTTVTGLDKGGKHRFVGYLLDINRLKELEQETARLYALANSEKQTRSLFLLSITYETKAPLHQFAETVEQMSLHPLRPDQERYLISLRASINRLKHCIDQIEEYIYFDSMRESDGEDMSYLPELLAPILHRYKDICAASGLSFDYEILNSDYIVSINSINLNRAMELVLDNAMKFTPAGSVKVSVSFIPQDDQTGQLSISVSDTGMGIPDTMKRCVFEPFNQIDNSYTREFGGLGLGLAILSRIMELNGGNILLTSEQTVGTNVTLNWKVKYTYKGDLS
ncbi:MAG: PAS domain-containing protein [Candidatus Cloacimonetes bacterium]|nr:PAS domain-containing protein [Candidatus Cloacimonadota bacterium]